MKNTSSRAIFCLSSFIFLLSSIVVFASEKILYSHLTDGYWQVWMMDKEGGGNEQITFSLSDKRDPTWMQGQEIIFRTNNGQLFSVDLKNKEEKEILAKFGNVHGPRYSKAAGKMVFVSLSISPFETSEVWIADLDGQNAKLITRDKRFKYQPGFSKNGEKIVFVKSDEDREAHNIWIMNADGSGQQQLTFDKARDSAPDLSPDEKWAVFSSNRENNNYDLYLLNLENKKTKKIVESPGLDSSPRFSPDGERIIFISTRGGTQQIWSVNSDGSNLRQLTQIPGESIDPGWMEVDQENKNQ
ncbi:MAG: hypothetical protein A2Z88_01485 [Omnitrophica WOR_2 bacterium GWA2_47_8]|nr:MAG: hypothetical protein A2Z88_01485 [Omnitrophica WOR_2 bacterium GWA2_47_8]